MSKPEGRRSIRIMSFQVSNNPIVFGKYFQFLTRKYGAQEANDMLTDYYRRKTVNSAKGEMVP